jgi:hypothetical protein
MTGSIRLSLAVGLLGRIQSGQIVPNTPPVPATRIGRKTKIVVGGSTPLIGSKGNSMDTAIIVGALIFAIGVVAGVVAIVSIGIQREERDFLRTGLISMTRRAPGPASGGARSLTGLYVGQRRGPDPQAVRYEDTLV